jgi:hypothetical protein
MTAACLLARATEGGDDGGSSVAGSPRHHRHADGATMKESRKLQRKLTFRTGMVLGDSAAPPIVCLVLNESDDGLCILVADAAVVPDCVDVTFDHDGSTRKCCVVWRDKYRVGLNLVDRPGSSAAPGGCSPAED